MTAETASLPPPPTTQPTSTPLPAAPPLPARGVLVGIGVGPGDPEAVTLQALRALHHADRVVAPSLAPDAVGRAESIVRQVAPEVPVERLVFDMSTVAHDRLASHRSAAAALGPSLDAGMEVAFVTLGDPNIYSTFSSVAAAVIASRPETVIRTVAGIMAFQDLAAADLDGLAGRDRDAPAGDRPRRNGRPRGRTLPPRPGRHRLQGWPPPAGHPAGPGRRRAD